jgi:hypothetical protein
MFSKIASFFRHLFGGVQTPDQRAALLSKVVAAVGVVKAGIGVAAAHGVIPPGVSASITKVEADIDGLAKLSAVSPTADFTTLAGVLNTAVALLPPPYNADAAAAVAVVNALIATL